jgi:hypothetical protein
MAVSMKITIFWIVKTKSMVGIYQPFTVKTVDPSEMLVNTS